MRPDHRETTQVVQCNVRIGQSIVPARDGLLRPRRLPCTREPPRSSEGEVVPHDDEVPGGLDRHLPVELPVGGAQLDPWTLGLTLEIESLSPHAVPFLVEVPVAGPDRDELAPSE